MSNSLLVALPPELLVYIIEELYEPQHMPHEAAWSHPLQHDLIAIDGKLQRGPSMLPITRLHMEGVPEGITLTSTTAVGLSSLRRVSRMFDKLCSPYSLRELDIRERGYLSFNNMVFEVPSDAAVASFEPSCVRSMRIYLGSEISETGLEMLEGIVRVLEQCHQATSIALYYRSGTRMLGPLQDEICRLIERSRLVNFGIYSTQLMQGSRNTYLINDENLPAINAMLNTALESIDKVQTLQRLDICMESMEAEGLKLIQSAKSPLRTLTVRRAFRSNQLAAHEAFNMEKWVVNRNLTRLYFAHCQPAHAESMLAVVQHFPALEELMWAISGHWADHKSPRPPPGWSKLPGSLPKIRRPLRLLHIEHAMEWEVFTLGQIPTEEVIIANAEEQIIQRVLSSATETFIGMKTLRVLPVARVMHSYVSVTDDDLRDEVVEVVPLSASCAERNVTLRHDARVLFPCSCCYWATSQPPMSESAHQ